MQGGAQEKTQPAVTRETHYRTVPLSENKQTKNIQMQGPGEGGPRPAFQVTVHQWYHSLPCVYVRLQGRILDPDVSECLQKFVLSRR